MAGRARQSFTVRVAASDAQKALKLLGPSTAAPSAEEGGVAVLRLEAEGPGDARLSMLALLLPDARVFAASRGKEKEVKPAPPKSLPAFMKCANGNCVTNQPREPVKAGFRVVSSKPLLLQCNYCERYADGERAAAELLGQHPGT
ncbi:MAG: hypothetical protein JRN21_04605 [Nitrososphaerota archaeon]|nr:hypothetical protein [Nitrososphaerota archaeon]